MPRQQVATVPVYEFGPVARGADPTAVPSLQFVAKRGGVDMQARVEAYEDPVTISAQVSVDSVTWVATTAAANGTVVTNLVVNPGGHLAFPLRLRQGLDKYLRFLTNARGTITLTGSETLDVQKL